MAYLNGKIAQGLVSSVNPVGVVGPVVQGSKKRAREQESMSNNKTYKKPKKPKSRGGAELMSGIQSAISLKGVQLAWTVLEGFKDIENRPFKYPVGWYALHVSKAKANASHVKDISDLLLPVKMTEEQKRGVSHWNSKIVGAIHISDHKSVEECEGNKWACGKVCNVIDKVVKFKQVFAASGQLSHWGLTGEEQEKIQKQISIAIREK
jgi:hypothetical protein